MYEKIGWEDSPSTKTPILAVSLNQMDNGIEKANKGIVFSYSATFTADGVVKSTTSLTSLGAGDFATNQVDIVTAFIANNVTSISSGTFANCTSLKTIYIDNTVDNINLASGAIPDGVNIVYCNDDNFINVNDLLANAIKSLKTKENQLEEQHKADVQALTDKANQLETQATKDRDTFNNQIENINESLDTKESLSNKVDIITHPSTTTYPSVKGVWDFVETKSEQPLADIEQNKADIVKLKADKVDNTDFNAYKTSNDTAVAQNATDIAQNVTNITAVKADVFQNAIKVTTDKSTNAVINDSSDKNILNLVCDSEDYRVKLYKKNLFDMSSCNVFTNDGAKTTLVDRENNIVTFTNNESSNSSGIYFRHTTLNGMKGYEVDYTKLLNKTVTLSFDIISNIECQMRFSFITNNWNNYTSITTSKQRIVITELVDISKLNNAITIYCKNSNAEITISNIQIEVSNVATDYEKCEFQSVDNSTDLTTVHTYYPRTTVIADSDCQLTYIADTKNYIDNKLNEIATALVASASSEEVM